jgi:hypothetical protein
MQWRNGTKRSDIGITLEALHIHRLLEFALDVHNSKVTTTTKSDMTCLGTQLDTMAQKGGSCAHGYEH